MFLYKRFYTSIFDICITDRCYIPHQPHPFDLLLTHAHTRTFCCYDGIYDSINWLILVYLHEFMSKQDQIKLACAYDHTVSKASAGVREGLYSLSLAFFFSIYWSKLQSVYSFIFNLFFSLEDRFCKYLFRSR